MFAYISGNFRKVECDLLFMTSDTYCKDSLCIINCFPCHITKKCENFIDYEKVNGDGSINAVYQDGSMNFLLFIKCASNK